MTAGDAIARVQERLDEDPSKTSPTYYPDSEVMAALNEAQRFFVLLTLCLETTLGWTLDASETFYSMRGTFQDWLLPLRIMLPTGARVRPARLAELDALDSGWQANVGASGTTPARYVSLGFDFLGVYPQAGVGGVNVNVTYARAPVEMMAMTDVPEIPEDYHPALCDYAIPRLRLKEGGQEFQKSQVYHQRFMSEAARMAAFVRERNLALRYDNLPFELRRMDRSKFPGVRMDLPARGQGPGDRGQ